MNFISYELKFSFKSKANKAFICGIPELNGPSITNFKIKLESRRRRRVGRYLSCKEFIKVNDGIGISILVLFSLSLLFLNYFSIYKVALRSKTPAHFRMLKNYLCKYIVAVRILIKIKILGLSFFFGFMPQTSYRLATSSSQNK
ncbi:hypothetical protein BpHYR1_025008 [Brachionus plicatilis]|uniref:Uncharacterized protein n=1 Tax=Brachionus plicatilis TaxID=10195 RepID=A0A3M7RZH0_BRAPC|nr:hypothetical protein BpHYR1_025008 [Brachionus plicatilis]